MGQDAYETENWIATGVSIWICWNTWELRNGVDTVTETICS